MRKSVKILILIVFGLSLAINQATARGLVPCGGEGEKACTLCDFFVLIDKIVDFVLFKLVPPLALLMLIIGGGMFMVATGNPKTISTAKTIIVSVLTGIAVIYGAYFLVGIFLQHIGLAEWTKTLYQSWWENGAFTIQCGNP